MPSALFLPTVPTSLNATTKATKVTTNACSTVSNAHTPTKTTHLSLSSPDPNAPWMKRPILLQPHELLNPLKPRNTSPLKNANQEKADKALLRKESGLRGKKAIAKIVKRIGKLEPKQVLVDTQESCGEVHVGESLNGIGGDNDVVVGRNFPWVRKDKAVYWRMKKERVVTEAESKLDPELLRELRTEARRMRKWVNVNKAGVTESVVDEINLAWKSSELAMVKFYLPLCRNMDRAREILEMKTGGLVVWTRKDVHVIYRRHNYALMESSNAVTVHGSVSIKDGALESISSGNGEEDKDVLSINGSLFERETDRLLEGLGPRFVDWWMRKPLPVDADLLPAVIPGFRPPSRRCPPDVIPKLKDDELTYLRKLAFSLPTHFALGRNRRLQGLAAAILKLWEKSPIAKIAVKWGIPNTNNEQMGHELKYLTGGVLLLRNKYFIILYRGKDFLPCKVIKQITHREIELKRFELNEESARLKAIEIFSFADEPLVRPSKVGTLCEFEDLEIKFGEQKKGSTELKLQLEAGKRKLEAELRFEERRLFLLQRKIEKSQRQLSKLNIVWISAVHDADQEMVTQEERECLRKIGLKMHSCLVLGRRGVFSGVIEGLHQHWKFREVVKVITMQRNIAQVICTANMLEAESGGILVSVDKLGKGHAILLYRGKNYKRPPRHLALNLLTKREALQRSLNLQRIGSLKFFANRRQCEISKIKLKLAELQEHDRLRLIHEMSVFEFNEIDVRL
ncbi:hypothetical protein K2173_004592 [Erythroxylum novogranatense]|uniref:CRM domain-containing protein n=1 Tax=Erythroxylum novogranatense TaxID=1862640 RepID=A0AAV8T4T5_9ROSI|nr:hypothetical protein K2173_004592 [Erythroxylum novogranatense]